MKQLKEASYRFKRMLNRIRNLQNRRITIAHLMISENKFI